MPPVAEIYLRAVFFRKLCNGVFEVTPFERTENPGCHDGNGNDQKARQDQHRGFDDKLALHAER